MRLISCLCIAVVPLFTGCMFVPDIPSTPPRPAAKPAPEPAHEELDSCKILRRDFPVEKADQVATLQTLPITRETQRVLRLKCDGSVDSDRIETVTSPRLDFDLAYPGSEKFMSVFVFNATSCDHKEVEMPQADGIFFGHFHQVTGDGVSKIRIKGDIAQALPTFNLDPGPNRLLVRYYYDCMPKVDGNEHLAIKGDGLCDKSTRFMTVLYPLQVDYQERLLDGTKTVTPSPEECAVKAEREKRP